MHFYLAQAFMLSYAFCAARQQAGIIVDYRNYVPIGTTGVKLLHKYGAIKTLIVGAILTLYQQGFAGYLALPFVAILWYSLIFDAALNYWTSRPFLYVGHTAWIDRKLWDLFGKNGGKRKVQICVGVILLLNVLYTIL